ncbi:hypothetical protein BZA70DRAFT_185600 [Myxozyma melibiosi]|uniref:PH domain-containing protein n=1 Tax=Myxozyma melibiosi TaxID=54550 RepID=A0ABR1F4N2_9ASCO
MALPEPSKLSCDCSARVADLSALADAQKTEIARLTDSLARAETIATDARQNQRTAELEAAALQNRVRELESKLKVLKGLSESPVMSSSPPPSAGSTPAERTQIVESTNDDSASNDISDIRDSLRRANPAPTGPPLPPRKSKSVTSPQAPTMPPPPPPVASEPTPTARTASITRSPALTNMRASPPEAESPAFDSSAFDLVRAFNESFDRNRLSVSHTSDSGADSSFDTAREESNAASSSPIMSSIYDAPETPETPVITSLPMKSAQEVNDQIGWTASEVRAGNEDAAHARQTSDSFSFEATAQDEYAIRWANRDQRDSTSSVEYIDSEDEYESSSKQTARDLADSAISEPFEESTSELATPTLGSTTGTIKPGDSRPTTGKSDQFPPRVQSFFPSRLDSASSTSASHTASAVPQPPTLEISTATNGLGLVGISDTRFPDSSSQETDVAAITTARLTPTSSAATTTQGLTSPDSPVYFPPSSPASSRDARSSIIPASAVFPPTNPNTIYSNPPIISQPSGPLITPENLPTIAVHVTSSRMRNFHKVKGGSKSDDPIIILSIRDRTADKEWWKVNKTLASLGDLDATLRPQLQAYSLPRLPERSSFVSLAPSKVDERRRILEGYFLTITSIPSLSVEAATLFCNFLSTDIMDPMALYDAATRKEGYLTKRGKNFGGWKARYFVLDGPELQYFDAPGGSLVGTIRLENAEIYKQETPNNGQYDDAPNAGDRAYRHALQISERKRADSNSFTRHILCAESDEERDDWVDALKEFTASSGSNSPSPSPTLPPGGPAAANQLMPGGYYNRTPSDQRSIMSVVSTSADVVSSSASSAVLPFSSSSPNKKKPKGIGISIASPISRKLRMGRPATAAGNSNDSATSPSSSTRPTSPATSQSGGGGGGGVLLLPANNGSSASLEYRSSPVESGRSTPANARPWVPSVAYTDLESDSFDSSTASLPHFDNNEGGLSASNSSNALERDLKKQKKRSIFSLRKETSQDSGLTVQAMAMSDQVRQQQQKEQDTRRFLQLDMDSLKNNPMYEYRASVSRTYDEEQMNGRRVDYDDDPKFKGEISCGGLKAIDKTIAAAVFGIPLAQAVEISFIQKGEVKVPSVLYRCIEYLDYIHANREEGLFRLSGSSSVIRALKERFNTGESLT